jgi:tRNA(fMet)-specific endonuclease VapC
MILLDTDICIEILRGNKTVIDHYQHADERAAISFMTVGELFYGAEKSTFKESNQHVVEEFLLSIDVINSDIEILRKFGEIKAALSRNHVSLADASLFIASTALTKCSKLITGNIKHYHRIENLVMENWI